MPGACYRGLCACARALSLIVKLFGPCERPGLQVSAQAMTCLYQQTCVIWLAGRCVGLQESSGQASCCEAHRHTAPALHLCVSGQLGGLFNTHP